MRLAQHIIDDFGSLSDQNPKYIFPFFELLDRRDYHCPWFGGKITSLTLQQDMSFWQNDSNCLESKPHRRHNTKFQRKPCNPMRMK
ncbi:hypothetical protein N7495_007446 [Penicillium taxi]|uniref:uncharacterized protein n=1 Tax=Penicillium taxi TaxID=168475 RepID=UPI002545AE7D|nr:uncharacterized protein N7495_007446 [Penicillium taxi]KAJ5887405.1 hypothetical protein N7495_007446 [Penicillium taxi]